MINNSIRIKFVFLMIVTSAQTVFAAQDNGRMDEWDYDLIYSHTNKETLPCSDLPKVEDGIYAQDYDSIEFNSLNLDFSLSEKQEKMLIDVGTNIGSKALEYGVKELIPGGKMITSIAKGTAKAFGYNNATDVLVQNTLETPTHATKGTADALVSGGVEVAKHFVPLIRVADTFGKATTKLNGYNTYTDYVNNQENEKDDYERKVDAAAELSKGFASMVPVLGPIVTNGVGFFTKTLFGEPSLTHVVCHSTLGRGEIKKQNNNN